MVAELIARTAALVVGVAIVGIVRNDEIEIGFGLFLVAASLRFAASFIAV